MDNRKSENTYFYFMPQLEIISSIDDGKIYSPGKDKEKNYISDLTELYSHNLLIVLAEPGNGKSRLLKEIVLQAEQNDHRGLFLDLKKCSNKTISDKLQDVLKLKTVTPKTNDEINTTKEYFFTKDFTTNTNPAIICLDALDEVKSEDIYDYIDRIKIFCADNPLYKVVVSCRDYIYKNYETTFKDINPTLLEVKPFNEYMVKQYLLQHKINEEDALQVIDHFFREYKLEVINSPRILELFTKIAEKEGVDKTLKKNKAELLELFIYGKLDIEEKKINSDKKELIKRVLEKLALVMEIYQSNQIKKDDLITFFDDVNSNLLSQIKVEFLYKHTILIPSSDGESIQFENAEFQEYLAAKEITRLGRIDQVLFDLTIDKKLRELIPSWANTMKYFFEIEPKIQPVVIDFIWRKNNYHNSDLLEQILISDSKYLVSIPRKERDKIFTKVFDLYQSNSWYFGYKLLGKLVHYYSEVHEEALKAHLVSKRTIQKHNAVSIISYLAKNDKLNSGDFYRKELLKIIRNKKSSDSLKRAAITTLASIKGISLKLIKGLYKHFENANNDALYGYLQAVAEVDPNDPFTIDLIFQYTIDKSLSIYPSTNLDKVTSSEGIQYYLKKISDDRELASRFSVHPPDHYALNGMFENISKEYNDEIKSSLKHLVLTFPRYGNVDSFVQRSIDLLKQKDPNILFELVDDVIKSDIYLKNWYTLNIIFARLLTKDNVLSFIKKMAEIPNSRMEVANLMIREFLDSKELEKQEIYKITKSHFKDEYSAAKENSVKQIKHQDGSDLKKHAELKFKLNPEPKKFMPDVFKFFDSNRNTLKNLITEDDRKRMTDLLEKTVLKYDFSKANLKVTEKSDGGSTFTFSRSITIFEDATQVLNDFEIDLTKYRKKLLEFLPYSFSYNNNTQNIFALIGSLTGKEINDLLKFYNTPRTDDLIEHNISNFFSICEKFNIVEAVPTIQKFVYDAKFENHYRIRALSLIQSLKPDNDFYYKLFTTYEKSSNEQERELALLANDFLILNDNKYRSAAISWRIKKMLDNPVERKIKPKNDNFHFHDIFYKKESLGKPLGMISDIKYLEVYLKFLDDIIELCKKNVDYLAYGNYLWGVIFNYLENLKTHGDYRPYEEAERTIHKHSDFKWFNLLQNSLFNLKMNYVKEMSKPQTLSECIKAYNSLKANQYNTVSTSRDFYYIINDIIEKDIKNWTQNEGAYRFLKKGQQQEDLIQKTIKTQFENGLLKRGFRDNEVRIVREEQLLDNKRTDFVISYGFVGQVLIEIKRTKNDDIKDLNYHKKLLQYIKGTKSDYGVYLIFQTDDKDPWSILEPEVKKQYEPHADLIKVIGFDCTKSN